MESKKFKKIIVKTEFLAGQPIIIYFFNLYYFECMHDVIYQAESALCNINKHHLQLNRIESNKIHTLE